MFLYSIWEMVLAFFYVTSVMRFGGGGLQCKLAARLGLKNASLSRELLPSAA